MVLQSFVYCKQPEHLKKLNYTRKTSNKLKDKMKPSQCFSIFSIGKIKYPFKKVFLPIMSN